MEHEMGAGSMRGCIGDCVFSRIGFSPDSSYGVLVLHGLQKFVKM